MNWRRWLTLLSNDEFLSGSVKAEHFMTRRMDYELQKESPGSTEFVGLLSNIKNSPYSQSSKNYSLLDYDAYSRILFFNVSAKGVSSIITVEERLGKIFCFNFSVESTIKMEVVSSSETSLNIYQTTRTHFAKDGNLCVQRRRNLKSHILRSHSFRTRLWEQLRFQLWRGRGENNYLCLFKIIGRLMARIKLDWQLWLLDNYVKSCQYRITLKLKLHDYYNVFFINFFLEDFEILNIMHPRFQPLQLQTSLYVPLHSGLILHL
jgi:uncharacterized membrane protein